MSKVTVMKEIVAKAVERACQSAYVRGYSDKAYQKSQDDSLAAILTAGVIGKVMLEIDQYEMVKRSHLQQLDAKSIEAWNILAGRCIPLDHIEATGEGYIAYGADAQPLPKEYDHTEFADAVIDVYNSYKAMYPKEQTSNPKEKK